MSPSLSLDRSWSSVLAASSGDPLVLAELGAIILGLAVLARIAARLGITPIPLYLIGGLLFGEGGLAPLDLSADFIGLASEIGVVLLLLTLGLEYTADELVRTLRTGFAPGLVDLGLNFTPGLVAGLALGWGPVTAILLGGVTYISSSGVIAKLLEDLGRTGNRETPAILGILVMEDLAMAAFLPIVAVLLTPGPLSTAALGLAIALATVVVILYIAVRHGGRLSRMAASQSDEGLLLTVLGATLLVAGLAQQLQVSSAVGAFLVGIAVSGPVSERATRLVRPLRDLFAATFFLFFGLQVDPSSLPGALPLALALAVVSAATKIVTGRYAAARIGTGAAGRNRAGAALVARGEFSIVLAGLGVAAGVDGELGATAAAYVLLLAVAGPLLAKFWPRPPRASAIADLVST